VELASRRKRIQRFKINLKDQNSDDDQEEDQILNRKIFEVVHKEGYKKNQLQSHIQAEY
jgi:hypothetical protein